MTHDAIVIGGGLLGGSVAYHLATGGADVLLLERGSVGREASWAGAGILAEVTFETVDDPLARLCSASLAYYGELVSEVEGATGLDVGFRNSGMLRIASDAAARQQLHDYAARAGRQGRRIEWLSSTQLREREPAISADILGGTYSQGDCQVHNPTLARALIQAAQARGAAVREGAPVTAFLRGKAGAVTGVVAAGEPLAAGTVVLAAGCWSGDLAATAGLALPVRPVRGQVVLLECLSPPFRHILLAGERYLVPRPGGRVYVGSTMEDVGFVKATTAAGVGGLIDFATGLVPALRDSAVVRTWSGLRPGNPDGLPFIGPVPDMPGLWVASGHLRRGILLAPITGKLVAESILTGKPSPLLTAFDPARSRS